MKPFVVLTDGVTQPFRREAEWASRVEVTRKWVGATGKTVAIFERGLRGIRVGTDGMYDEDRMEQLRYPWKPIAERLLELGGMAVEIRGADQALGRRLLAKATLRTRDDVSVARPTYRWECAENAVELQQTLPGAQLAIGLALHNPFWVFHTWLVMPDNSIAEATNVADRYFGVTGLSDADWQHWISILGGWKEWE